MAESPPWFPLLRDPVSGDALRWSGDAVEGSRRWLVRGNTLCLHPDVPDPQPRPRAGRLHRMVVDKCYASHNNSPVIARALERVYAELSEPAFGLNLGSGFLRLHPRLIAMDLEPRDEVDLSADAHRLPFGDGTLAAVVSQEVFEHLEDPVAAMAEVARVLGPGGLLYLQVPFVIGYHPGPTDLWRFSREGIRRLVEDAGLDVEELDVAVGSGTGMFRISVEFAAVLGGVLGELPYKLAKGGAALVLKPMTWLDPVLDRSSGRDRIPGGYYVLARKPR